MKLVWGLLFFAVSLQASLTCKEYNSFTTKLIGKSPPVNMLIQTIKELEFPKKISKKDSMFQKLETIESLLLKKVELVVLWNSSGEYMGLEEKLNEVAIDTCSLDLNSIYNYNKAYKSIGRIIKKEKRAEVLARYITDKLKEIEASQKQIQDEKRVKIYYAKGRDGLETECRGSVHSEFIEIIGAINPIECKSFKKSRVSIGYEKLLLLNPDVIITKNNYFYKELFMQARHKHLKAVKNKRVYLIPTEPINWLDNPPSFFRILGIYWLADKVYPKYYDIDIEKEKREFFQLFLHRSDFE